MIFSVGSALRTTRGPGLSLRRAWKAARARVLPLPNGFVRFAVHRAHDMIGVRAAVAATAPVARTTSGGAPIGRGLSATWTGEA
ncbi:hypothetical protein [Streptomyces triticiradicis]|uniref:Uncharacterized protein n=1 Tax=Streptomyces triticiradicis TaxID=2651189 RepID=A0A7J5DFQ0_9ACTN|nr:hypothetical protein [Streptomyces triticiradicis]KAB1987506.1 hypothetical protein F8144_17455 [Streptomyces triticiradicis]